MNDGLLPILSGIVIALLTILFVPTTVDDYLMLWDFIGPHSMYATDINFRHWGGQVGWVLGGMFVLWVFRKNFLQIAKIPGFGNRASFVKMLVTYIVVSFGVMSSV